LAGLTAFLRNLEQSVRLSIYDTNLTDEMAAALISEKIGLDFDDTLQYYVAKKLGVDAVVGFDEHFDKLDLLGVERRDLIRSTQKQDSPN
jgi:predicted nucleic acid-binding protein